jgi:hypothetical protein
VTTFRTKDNIQMDLRQIYCKGLKWHRTRTSGASVVIPPYVNTTTTALPGCCCCCPSTSSGLWAYPRRRSPQLPSARKGRPGTQDSWCVPRALRAPSSLHRADRPFHRDQDQGAPTPQPSGAARQISRGRTQHQPGPQH